MTASDIGVTNILSLSVRERNPWPVLREKPPPPDARCCWLAVRRGVQPSAVTTPLWKRNPCCCILDWLQNSGHTVGAADGAAGETLLGRHVLSFFLYDV